ncbi:hypothetical protein ABKN59_000862 [Abortiporus biennis]
MLRHGTHRTISSVSRPPQLWNFCFGAVASSQLHRSTRDKHPRHVPIHSSHFSTTPYAVPPIPDSVRYLSADQITSFNDIVPSLRRALNEKDVKMARDLWAALVKHDLVRFLGTIHLEMISRELANFFRNGPDDLHIGTEEEASICAMSLVTAARGNQEGLKSYLIHLLRQGHPQLVVEVYDRYSKMFEEYTSLADAEERKDHTGEEEEEVSPDVLEAEIKDPSSHSIDIQSYTPTTNPPAGPTIPYDLVQCVVVAYSLLDTPLPALAEVIRTRTRLRPALLATFLTQLNFDWQMRSKVETYATRVDLARIVHNSLLFSRHISALADDNNSKKLLTLVTSLKSELQHPQAIITCDPASVGTEKPVLLSDAIWGSFLLAFMKCQKVDLAEKLWDDMVGILNGRTPVVAWNALIDGFVAQRQMKTAAGVWDSMVAQKIHPDAMSYRSMIHGMYNTGDVAKGDAFFKRFLADPSFSTWPEYSRLVVFNSTLHGLLFNSMEKEAKDLLLRMKNRGPKPDIVSYNTFLRFYGRRPAGRQQNLKAFAETLKAIEEDGLVGDAFTFSTVLVTLIEVRDDAAQLTFTLMEKQGVKPNVTMFTAIINHLVKQGRLTDLQTAFALLNKMERDDSADVRPNEITYTTILKGVLRASWLDDSTMDEYRQSIDQKLKDRNLSPTRVTYHMLMLASLENPNHSGVQNALHYYREMREMKVGVGHDTWYILLNRLVRRKEWEVAEELVRDMESDVRFVPSASLQHLVTRIKQRRNWQAKQRTSLDYV